MKAIVIHGPNDARYEEVPVKTTGWRGCYKNKLPLLWY